MMVSLLQELCYCLVCPSICIVFKCRKHINNTRYKDLCPKMSLSHVLHHFLFYRKCLSGVICPLTNYCLIFYCLGVNINSVLSSKCEILLKIKSSGFLIALRGDMSGNLWVQVSAMTPIGATPHPSNSGGYVKFTTKYYMGG